MRLLLVLIVAALVQFGAVLPLRADVAKWRDIAFDGQDGKRLGGTLFQPELSDGHLPGVVLLHDCFGVREFQRLQALTLAEAGFIALLLDLGADADCTRAPAPSTGNAVAAGHHLKTLKGVDAERIGLIGWGADMTFPDGHPFAAVVGVYPVCRRDVSPPDDLPMLILTGQDDDWTPPAACLGYVTRQTGEETTARIRIYPGAAHGFDNTGLSRRETLDGAFRPHGEAPGPVTIAHNRLAHEDARKRIEDFLNSQLQLTLAKAYPSKAYSPLPLHADRDDTPAVNQGRGHWVIDPATTEPNRPPVGRSVFDRVFSKVVDGKAVYDVPFPHADLIAHLNQRLKPGRSGGEPVKQVLFPMGRSLQREAAAPHYFTSPRVVVAIDGEPDPGFPGRQILLKDRLFLGYVEETEVLEVISYNEAARRFEFQVVKNYAPGKTPDVFHADRQVCTSCHQNKSPLFPRENWTETNAAGGQVLKRLLSVLGDSFHGIALTRSGEVPAKIDLSTDRANLFSVLQLLWAEGCDPGDDIRARRCRAAAFTAMLQYRLANTHDFERTSDTYMRDFQGILTRNWRNRWPGGLFIPNSDIPDRNPLGHQEAITGSLDPLTKRGPMEVWSGFRKSDPERLITGFAEQFTVDDIRKLDAHLTGLNSVDRTRTVSVACTVAFNPRRGLDHPHTLTCGEEGGSPHFVVSLSNGMRSDQGGRVVSLEIDGLAIGDKVDLEEAPEQRNLFSLSRNGLAARLPSGERIERIAFTPLRHDNAAAPLFREHIVKAWAELVLIDDFASVRDAVQTLAERNDDFFSAKPFHGPRLLNGLFAHLGLPAREWCCAADTPAPPIRIDRIDPLQTADSRIHAKSLQLVTETCGGCHRTNNPHPPNFLAGSPREVLNGIAACAPRILRRLALWDLPASERDQTAMPPLGSLHMRGLTAEMWRTSPEIEGIRHFVKVLAAERGPGAGTDSRLNCTEAPETVERYRR